MKVRGRLIACCVLAIAAGLAYPYGELAWQCRAGSVDSEACVWTRAYFPLSRWIEAAIVAPIVLSVSLLALRLADRNR